jgi:hypothetical protein
LVPGQRSTELVGKVTDRLGNRVPNGVGPVSGQCRTVLGSRVVAVIFHTRQVQQQREPGGRFDERADRGAVESEDEVALPVTRNGAVIGFGRGVR